MGKQRFGIDAEKSVDVKGIETVEEEVTQRDPFEEALSKQFPKSMDYRLPTTEEDARVQALGTTTATSKASQIKGFTGIVDADALKEIYASVDLAQGIPDAHEREKFKAYHGDKMVKLFGNDTFGVKFQRDLYDLAVYKEKAYPRAVKKFIDDLDENQAWYTALGLTATKLVGKTLLGVVGNLVGSVYGAGSALAHGDVDKFYNNSFFDAVEYMDQGMDKHLAIYGGSDVWDFEVNPETGVPEFKQKNFFGRFWQDPLKSINADVVPAVAFVAEAVISETIAAGITGATGGLGYGTLASTTARLGSKFNRLGQRMAKFGKANRIIRGLDKIDDVKNASKIAGMTQKYRSALGTVTSGYRSASYESALIARDTKRQTYDTLVQQYITQNPGVDSVEDIPADKLKEFSVSAEHSGEYAYMMNIPLVAGSHFVQMPRLFLRNYRVASTTKGLFNKWKLGGVQYKAGKYVANVNANKYLKALGYTGNILKGPVTEAWEEFAQGAMGEGLVDYYANLYSQDANKESMSMMNAIYKQAGSYLNTIEGQDSVTIGALMGLLGVRVPVFTRNKQNKFGFSVSTKGFGGSRQEFMEARRKMQDAQSKAEALNSDAQLNPVLAENFKNTMRHLQIQKDMDAASNAGDIHTYKNKEFDQLFSVVQTRAKMGMGATVMQELEAMKSMDNTRFNEEYGVKQVDEYSPEEQQQVLGAAQENVKRMLESIDTVNTLMGKMGPDMIQKAYYNVTGKKKTAIDVLQEMRETTPEAREVFEAFKDQLGYLHATVENTKQREIKLMQEIQDKTGNSFSMGALDKIVAQITGVNLEEQKVEFRNQAEGVKKEILKEWKEKDADSYYMNEAEVSPLLDDVLKLKVRRGEAAKMYQGLFKPKGAEAFLGFAIDLMDASAEKKAEILEEQLRQNAKDAKNAKMAKEAVNERSVTGNTNITDSVLHPDAVAGLNAYEEIMTDEGLSKENKQEAALALLDKHPGLFTLVKDRLLEDGVPIQKIATAEELEMEDADGTLTAAVLAKLPQLLKESKLRAEAQASGVKVNSADQLGQAQGTSEVSPTLNKEQIEAEVLSGLFAFNGRTNSSFTMVNTMDKEIDGDVGPDGRPLPHDARKTEKDRKNNPIDTAKVNSPEFLNNKELNEENHYFEFRIQHENPYNSKEGTTVDNMAIEIIHVDPTTKEETFISLLPAYKAGRDALHLKALREEIERRDGLEDDGAVERNVERIKEIKEEKAAIKEELKKPVEKEPGAVTAAKEINEIIAERTLALEELEFDESTQMKLDAYEAKDYLRYEKELIIAANKSIEGRTLVDTFAARLKLANPDSTVAEKLMAEYFLADTGRPYSEAQLSSLQKEIDSEFSTIPAGTGKPYWNDTRREQKKLYDKIINETETTEKTLEERIEEVQANQEFIQLAEDEKTYVNSKTGKEYTRVSNYIDPEGKDIDNQELIDTAAALGTKADVLVRDFFAGELKDYTEYDLAEPAIMDSFIESLQKVKDAMEERGETVLANGVILYNDELGVAGEVDLLTHDKEGVVRIYDMKTMRATNGNPLTPHPEYGTTKYESTYFGKSNKQRHTEQLSMYRILLNNTHGIKAETLGIMPILIDYEVGETNTKQLELEKGIPLTPLDVVRDATLEETGEKEDEATQALKDKLGELNDELKQLTGGELDVEFTLTGSNLFGDITDVEAIPESASERKEQKEQEMISEYGEENIERAKAINENFDDIVDQLVASGINVFFDPRRSDRSKKEQHQRC